MAAAAREWASAGCLVIATIFSEQIVQYLERWRLVEEREISELRETPIETTARQLAALMASRDLFGEDPDRENGVNEVRARWARLRKALGG